MKHLTAKKYAHLPELEAHEIGRPHFRLKNYLVSGLGDYRAEPMWDIYAVAPSTAVNKQVLFSIPQNNPFTIPGGATFTKTPQSTSMQKSAELPQPERYIARGICIYMDNSMNQADVAQFASQCYVNLEVSKKSFFQIPLAGKLPAGGGAWAQQVIGVTSLAVGASVTGNGLPSEAGGGYPLTQPGVVGTNSDGSDSFPQVDGILIAQATSFSVTLDPTLAAHINAPGTGFVTAATTDYAPGIGVVLWVLLEGTHVVAVQ